MRLWHQDLIKKLPRNQLLGQHRECCALRGNGWGKKHSTINYIFSYSLYHLYSYHLLIMEEMKKRGYMVSKEWLDKNYRGKNIKDIVNIEKQKISNPIYIEHDEKYLDECLENLKNKGIILK